MKLITYQILKKKGYDFFVGVPCSGIKDLVAEIQKDATRQYIPATKEDTAVAIAFGAKLAGKKPLVFMQNSGLGNIVNVVTSLIHVYNMPVDLLVSDRKEPIEHKFMHKITKELVKLLDCTKHTILVEQRL